MPTGRQKKLTFAAIGIGMNGLLTALLVPLFVALWN